MNKSDYDKPNRDLAPELRPDRQLITGRLKPLETILIVIVDGVVTRGLEPLAQMLGEEVALTMSRFRAAGRQTQDILVYEAKLHHLRAVCFDRIGKPRVTVVLPLGSADAKSLRRAMDRAYRVLDNQASTRGRSQDSTFTAEAPLG